MVLPGTSSDANADDEGGTTTTTSVSPTSTLPPLDRDIYLLGDSTMAAMRWFVEGTEALKGFRFNINAESCRRIEFSSCKGREERVPSSAHVALENTKKPVDTVVLMAGYHSSVRELEVELKRFIKYTEKKNIDVVILTFSESKKYMQSVSKTSQKKESTFAVFNRILRKVAERREYSRVMVADWNKFAKGQSEWFRPDGIHLTVVGVTALGWFISATIANLYNGPCPHTNSQMCDLKTLDPSSIDWLSEFGVRYTDVHCYEDGPRRVSRCEKDRRLVKKK